MPAPSPARTTSPTDHGGRDRCPRDGASRRRAARRARGLLWRGRFVVAAACCGLAATVVVQALRPPPPATVDVVVPAHRLEAGSATGADDLETRTVAAALVPDGALTDPAAAVGRSPATDLPAGLPLHADLLPGGGVVAQAPDGSVVVPVRLDDAATGWLRPGDRVDLLGRDDGPDAPADAKEPGDDGGEGDYLARRALVLPSPAVPETGGTGSGGTGPRGLLDVGGSPAASGEVTLVAVSPEDAPRLSAASGWSTIGAVLVP